jgi:hypothetical protein
MELTKDFESLIHLIARAFGRASGNQTPEVHADVVLEHAKALAAEDAQRAAGKPEASSSSDTSSTLPDTPATTSAAEAQ